jgi:Thioesterase-like superfamily
MAGLLRSLLTLFWGLFRYKSQAPSAMVVSWFWVTPLDTGIATLKSDRYFQLAESAQIDFMVKTGLIGDTFKRGYRFVNAAQLVKFIKPIRLFSRVQVRSQVIYADEKCAYFSHVFHTRGILCAELLVKMKFKRGSLTIAPMTVLGVLSGEKPEHLQRWDDALASI